MIDKEREPQSKVQTRNRIMHLENEKQKVQLECNLKKAYTMLKDCSREQHVLELIFLNFLDGVQIRCHRIQFLIVFRHF